MSVPSSVACGFGRQRNCRYPGRNLEDRANARAPDRRLQWSPEQAGGGPPPGPAARSDVCIAPGQPTRRVVNLSLKRVLTAGIGGRPGSAVATISHEIPPPPDPSRSP